MTRHSRGLTPRAGLPLSEFGSDPLSLGALHRVVSEHLARSFPRPTMVRIHEVSRGSPFYAIEIAREIDSSSPVGEDCVSGDTVGSGAIETGQPEKQRPARVAGDGLPGFTNYDQVARATGIGLDVLIELLEQAESRASLRSPVADLQFAHPLLARGVYDSAAPAQRREMHRRLAEVVNEPESRANTWR